MFFYDLKQVGYNVSNPDKLTEPAFTKNKFRGIIQ